ESFATNPSPNKIMILGDMLELGAVSRQEHQHVVDKAKELHLNTYFVGSEFAQLEQKHDFQYFKNAQELIDHLTQHELPDAAILIKGSRGIRLEQVADYIQKKGQ
ncbi:MAG: UDP-N-acetylmuramoyl-tripeptide--D-alanyl-D-alanine ligase, partial [Flavobacteriales bacterium]|nr:UDP-N-acetylmuramoyl-tripeptide--D-alanyl-D-alanine ligase [Flavobacteriales bacterium]